MHLQTISNSIVYDNLRPVSAIIVDCDGSGLGNAYVCKRFQIALSITM
jgi:hypothetical protein